MKTKSLIPFLLLLFALKSQAQTITIPVVVHVVWKTAAQNISDAQVQSQIDVLNEDYGRTNPDAVNTPAVWQSIAANTGIQFCLAQTDPSGNPTTGIIHKQTTVTSFTTDNKIKFTAQGGDDAWNVTQYFNIWVCNLGAGLLGYAEYPSPLPSNTYGTVISYVAFGRIGTVISPYDKGRTCTFEVGRCFNLLSLAADPGCADTDSIPDTPTPSTAPVGCPAFPFSSTCNPSGAMFMNFMVGTVDDACKNLFTIGQKQRMNNMLNAPPYNALATSAACSPVGLSELNNSSSISVFPNPSSGKFTIETKGGLTVYNLFGEKIYYQNLSSEKSEIDLTKQPNGIYFISLINSAGEKMTAKMAITK